VVRLLHHRSLRSPAASAQRLAGWRSDRDPRDRWPGLDRCGDVERVPARGGSRVAPAHAAGSPGNAGVHSGL